MASSVSHELGKKIRQTLIKHSLENQVDFTKVLQWHDSGYFALLQEKLTDFINLLGLNHSSQMAGETALRLLNLYVKERFSGLNYDNFPKITLSDNEFNYTNPLIASDIPLKTTCEHHLVPIIGSALIAYRPKKHIVGLSKLNLILNFFANRPQLQERLTKQVFITISEILQSDDVAVVLNAKHDCMCIEGIRDTQTIHSTHELGGVFVSDPVLKNKILDFSGKIS